MGPEVFVHAEVLGQIVKVREGVSVGEEPAAAPLLGREAGFVMLIQAEDKKKKSMRNKAHNKKEEEKRKRIPPKQKRDEEDSLLKLPDNH